MNTFTSDNRHIMAADGTLYEVNVAHPMPLPEGIEQDKEADDFPCLAFAGHGGWTADYYGEQDTHWCARPPLPPKPQPKTQAELDEDGFRAWWRTKPLGEFSFCDAFHAGCAHARGGAK